MPSHLDPDRACVLVADIGGTNARFALALPGTQTPFSLPSIATGGYPSFEAAATQALVEKPNHLAYPKHAIIAVAGPVTGALFPLTNASWMIDAREILTALSLETLIILNDFEAQALALPALRADDLIQIGGGEARPDTAKVVIGPGTGLGVGGLIRAVERWVPVPGEGGHVEIGPLDSEDHRIWPYIKRNNGRIGAEQILSGIGLLHMAQAVSAADGRPCPFENPSDITDAAQTKNPIAVKALDTFARALGRVAGDMALTFLARGGVYIGGGIAPRIADILATSGFRQSFEAKAPHQQLMAQIPTYLITHPAPALAGLAAFASAPEAFAVDLTGRRWETAGA